jgi:hypothetical protein
VKKDEDQGKTQLLVQCFAGHERQKFPKATGVDHWACKNLTIISKGIGLCPTFVAEKIDLRGEIAWMAGSS